MKNFSKRLQQLMQMSGVNEKELAEKISVSESTIKKYLAKNYYPRVGVAMKMVQLFNCSLDFLCGRSDKFNNKTKS